MEYWQICDVIGIRFTRVVKTAFWIKRLRNTDYPTVIVLDFLKCSQIFSPRFHNLIFKGTILRQVGILPQTLVSDQLSKHPFFRFNHKTEKNTIRRKAKKCGMNMSEYLRSLGTGAAVREAPRRELMLAYQKLTTLHDTVRYELAMRDFDEALTEIESLLLRAYHGKEDADGGDEDLGNP